jgi:cobalt-zinc-cadmium efflux system outer membrane protein
MAMRKCIFFIIFSVLSLSPFVFAQDRDVLEGGYKNGCDLQKAIDIALKNNPELTAMALELDAAEARVKQAGLWSNPVFEAESEDFSGDNPGFSHTQNTFSITQPFLLGGKIKHRKSIAEKEKEILQLRYEATKTDLITKVKHVVYHILLEQKNLEFENEIRNNAKKLHDFIAKKAMVEDEDSIQFQLLSAEIELSQAELEVLNAKKDLEIAKRNLTILWGAPEILLAECKGSLDRKFNVPEYNELKKYLLENNPEIRAINLQQERGDFLLKSAKAERIPDVEVGFGYRRMEEDNTNTFVAGFSIPLPLFNRNQGSIQEALVNQKKVEVDGNVIRNRLLFELNEAYKTFQTAMHEANVLKDNILPRAQHYFAHAVKGYNEGALEYLEVLNGKRTLIETEKRYVKTLHVIQLSVASLERLCSRHLHGDEGEMF